MPYGNLNADVVQSSTAGTPVQFNDGNGTQVGTLCRAWVKFAGSTAVIGSSFNVSSITRSAAGNYVVNLTNAVTDTNYCVLACGDYSNTTGDAYNFHNVWAAAHPITTSTAAVFFLASGTYYDGATMSVAIFR